MILYFENMSDNNKDEESLNKTKKTMLDQEVYKKDYSFLLLKMLV